MNKKGFTLIELIVVIAIISSIGIYGIISISKSINSTKIDKYNDMISNIKSAASTFLAIYSEKEVIIEANSSHQVISVNTASFYQGNALQIPIGWLKATLLLNSDLTNPKDNTAVDGCVIMTYNNNTVTSSVCLKRKSESSTSSSGNKYVYKDAETGNACSCN